MKRITSPKIITAKMVVKVRCCKTKCGSFFKCIIPIALNQQIIEIILMKLLTIERLYSRLRA